MKTLERLQKQIESDIWNRFNEYDLKIEKEAMKMAEVPCVRLGWDGKELTACLWYGNDLGTHRKENVELEGFTKYDTEYEGNLADSIMGIDGNSLPDELKVSLAAYLRYVANLIDPKSSPRS